MLEAWMRGSLWSEGGKVLEDREELKPRSQYASQVTGAYYAARLGVLEHLESIQRSAACLIWRDIGAGYWAPVGVWLIRETVREAMKQTPKQFDSLSEAINYVGPRISVKEDLQNSWFVKREAQTRLDSF